MHRQNNKDIGYSQGDSHRHRDGEVPDKQDEMYRQRRGKGGKGISKGQRDVHSQGNRTESRSADVNDRGFTGGQDEVHRQSVKGSSGLQEGVNAQGFTGGQEEVHRQSDRGISRQQGDSNRHRDPQSYGHGANMADRQERFQSDERDGDLDSSVSFPGEAPVFQHGELTKRSYRSCRLTDTRPSAALLL